MRPTILMYNPKSTSPGKQRLPLSLLAVAAVAEADYETEFVDGNLVADPAERIIERAKATGAKLLAVTVMPGPQLVQAVPVCRRVKAALPDLQILWGGYFPTQHADVCLTSGHSGNAFGPSHRMYYWPSALRHRSFSNANCWCTHGHPL